MRAIRARSADQCTNAWQICFVPAPSGLSEYLSANRACPDSCPGSSRLVLQGVSASAARLKSCTSVTLALAGIVAQSVTELASVSVQAGAAGVAVSAETPGGEVAPGTPTTPAGRHGAPGAMTTTPAGPILGRTPAPILARAPAGWGRR